MLCTRLLMTLDHFNCTRLSTTLGHFNTTRLSSTLSTTTSSRATSPLHQTIYPVAQATSHLQDDVADAQGVLNASIPRQLIQTAVPFQAQALRSSKAPQQHKLNSLLLGGHSSLSLCTPGTHYLLTLDQRCVSVLDMALYKTLCILSHCVLSCVTDYFTACLSVRFVNVLTINEYYYYYYCHTVHTFKQHLKTHLFR